MLTFIKNMFTKARTAYVRARARWITRRWIRKAIKNGVPVITYDEIEHEALAMYEKDRGIDVAFFAQPDDAAEIDSEAEHYRRMTSTVELRWECEEKYRNTSWAQMPDESPLDYRARLLRVLDQ